MNKNSILAVVLSGLVLFAYIFVQTKFFSPVPQTAEENNVEQIEEENDSSAENVTLNDEVEFKVADENETKEIIAEKNFVIETNKVRVTFTNRGGDVTSIELINHEDSKTKKPVEMAENVSSGHLL